MQRILIIGSPGSGKSRLSVLLGTKLNLPVVHLDKLFWLDGWTSRDKEEFDSLLLKELEKDKWIIDGNFKRTLELRLKYADSVILLNYPSFVCRLRVLKRIVFNRRKTRPDMANNCPERYDRKFMQYVKAFKKESLPAIKKILQEEGAKVIEITNDRQLKLFLQNVNTYKN